MSADFLFRPRIQPDPLDVAKESDLDRQREDREELRDGICKAMGWQNSTITILDSNLIATAKEKLLTTPALRGEYARHLTQIGLLEHSQANPWAWALTQASVTQQARALLKAVTRVCQARGIQL